MTHPTKDTEMMNDPSGSIFLPKTRFPEREFESWQFQLLLGRGIAEGKTSDEIFELHEELVQVRLSTLGALAIERL